MAQEGEAGLVAVALAEQARLGVGRALVGVVAPQPAFEVAAAARRAAGIVLGSEALVPGPGHDERAVDAEVLVTGQVLRARLADDRPEEGLGDVAAQQALAVLGEDRDVPDPVVDLGANEPAEEQVVLELSMSNLSERTE